MDMQKTGDFIHAARKKLNMSQRALGEYLRVTDKAVSKWERGVACPDIEILKNMSVLFGCSISDIINSNTQVLKSQCASFSDNTASDGAMLSGMEHAHQDVEVTFDLDSAQYISPLLFGDNLEHTRGCINGGLSAELLRNRKFIGHSDRYGCAHEWYPIGNAFFHFGTKFEFWSHGSSYTRHAEGYKMTRSHERNAQYITNYYPGTVGFGQKDLYLRGNTDHVFEIAMHATKEMEVTVALTDRDRNVYDSKILTVHAGDYEEQSVTLHTEREDFEARLEITFSNAETLMIGAVSLMPKDNFRGMRWDVIDRMKELGIRVLRWPGGNFAGEYYWKDGLLPRNMRSPLQSYLGIETQPHTTGYDYHDINTDDFVALCREIGAEPFITLNPTWCTPEESAQWVEYCNGDETTEYGRLRIERGFEKPYNVQFWSLGNEAGYGHMEGANTAEAYAKAVREHALQMLRVTPGLTLCSSGPYPNQEWIDGSVKALSDIVSMVSLHHYTEFPSFMDASVREQEYSGFVAGAHTHNCERIRELRRQLGALHVKISFDEWNAWYAWYRPGSVSEGIFAAAFLNMLFQNADEYGVGMACHFESVNEGSIQVYPQKAVLAPTGTAISLMSQHAGGMVSALCQDVVATHKDGILTCTLINRSYGQEKHFTLNNSRALLSAEVYTSEDVVPTSTFRKESLAVSVEDACAKVVLPAHSIAVLKMKID